MSQRQISATAQVCVVQHHACSEDPDKLALLGLRIRRKAAKHDCKFLPTLDRIPAEFSVRRTIQGLEAFLLVQRLHRSILIDNTISTSRHQGLNPVKHPRDRARSPQSRVLKRALACSLGTGLTWKIVPVFVLHDVSAQLAGCRHLVVVPSHVDAELPSHSTKPGVRLVFQLILAVSLPDLLRIVQRFPQFPPAEDPT